YGSELLCLVYGCYWDESLLTNIIIMAKFEVYQSGKKMEYRFRLKADNGQIILSSEGYTTKAACLNGVESVKKNAADPKRFNKTTTPSGLFRFNLTAANSQVIGTSQNYKSESGCDNGMASVGKNAPLASVVEADE
ncbi:MAG: YegP family protein, partial [Bacteroidales bacterium]|nr:YegP family protein [Bacteroidales bacterium]MDD3871593.1 YegP family protein [Bacteroidales bacterium]